MFLATGAVNKDVKKSKKKKKNQTIMEIILWDLLMLY